MLLNAGQDNVRRGVLGLRRERALDFTSRLLPSAGARHRAGATEYRAHRVFPAVEPVRLGEPLLAIELFDRLVDIVLGQTDQPEQPVQAERRIPPTPLNLAILNRGALAKNG